MAFTVTRFLKLEAFTVLLITPSIGDVAVGSLERMAMEGEARRPWEELKCDPWVPPPHGKAVGTMAMQPLCPSLSQVQVPVTLGHRAGAESCMFQGPALGQGCPLLEPREESGFWRRGRGPPRGPHTQQVVQEHRENS